MARIVLVHPGDDSYGIDRVALKSVHALTTAGHTVICLLDSGNPGSGWLSKQLSMSSVDWHPVELAHVSRKSMSGVGELARWFWTWLRSSRSVVAHTRRSDLVYVNGLTMVPAAVIARLAGRRVLWHLHEIPGHGHLIGRVVRTVSSRQLCVSRAVETSLHLRSARSRIVYNGVDLPDEVAAQAPATPEHPVRIGIVARINAWKGHQVLVEAFIRLQSERLPCQLVVVGGSHPNNRTMEQRLHEELAPYLSSGAAVLVGEVEAGSDAMKSLDVLAAPSTRPDPCPVTVLEAMAQGLPVVASNLGGHPEQVVDGVTGLVVPPSDPVALATALARLVESEDLRSTMGAAGRARCADRFSGATFAANLTSAVNWALG